MPHKQSAVIILFLIFTLGAFFRFWHIADAPPGLYHDEAINGNNAIEALTNNEFKLFYPENNGREGLYINMLAPSIAVFGQKAWAIRIVSALFGTLTILGIYLLAKELFHTSTANDKPQIMNYGKEKKTHNSEYIALLSAFLLASSFWHIVFSRIGFRGILVPFFLVWSFYFLYRMIRSMQKNTDAPQKQPVRRGKYSTEIYAVLGGILFGLGFHTYIAYRLAPLLLIPPVLLAWRLYKQKKLTACAPCMLVLFLFAAFVAALPIGYYFLQNPADFAGRTGQVSAFAAENPAATIGNNIVQTAGMFFWTGDRNWRHNIAGAPHVWWLVSVFFAAGLFTAVQKLRRREPKTANGAEENQARSSCIATRNTEIFLLAWLLIMALPAVISNEGIPHALRTIGMIPPVMILSALGGIRLFTALRAWFAKRQEYQPLTYVRRVNTERRVLVILVLTAIPAVTWSSYFQTWAVHPETSAAFNEEYTAIGSVLKELPPELPKYVIVRRGGVLVRGIPMPAHSAMFFADGGIARRGIPTPHNITYLLPEDEYIVDELIVPHVAVPLE